MEYALKSGEPVMLDGMRLDELEHEIGLPVHALDFDGVVKMLSG